MSSLRTISWILTMKITIQAVMPNFPTNGGDIIHVQYGTMKSPAPLLPN